MGSKWRKARLAFSCVQIPSTLDDNISSSSSSPPPITTTLNGVSNLSISSTSSVLSPTTTPSSKSSKQKKCAICLSIMIPGQGHAIFTAECSHSFHFSCITSNVKHGHRACPVCRAKWKEVPFQSQNSELLNGKIRTNSDDPWMAALQPLPLPLPDSNRGVPSIFHTPEPRVFDDDDDLIEVQDPVTEHPSSYLSSESSSSAERVEIRTYPEVPAIPKSSFVDNFMILIHLKAPVAKMNDYSSNLSTNSLNSRAPVDLVTVLDISGSMAGTKLALLKRAMGFVIQHLGPRDRLSVVAFSSTARRVFPLRRMNDSGRQQALRAVNSLCSNGGTNIAEGLKKGAKVMLERKSKNPVSSIILLSDGQDTYTVSSSAGTGTGTQSRTDYKSLLPVSIQQSSRTSFQIPVHTFGFGADHDSVSMHSISERSGGTFSFIEAESVIQDAFAQCMGGLLSVVVQELKVVVECLYPTLQLGSIKAGSYQARLMPGARTGEINVGDLYAEEERDFLVTVNVPLTSVNEMPLLKVSYSYKDPISKEAITLAEHEEVKIQRPETAPKLTICMEVDRQLNRLRAAEAMSEARSAAERGDLTGAVAILEKCRKALSESESARAADPLCVSLGNEMKEMQERMSNRRVYEASGRAYVLSGLSSHSWQRATARGDSTSSTNLSQAYQTSTMTDMITRSQTMVLGSVSPHPTVRLPRSLSGRPRPR